MEWAKFPRWGPQERASEVSRAAVVVLLTHGSRRGQRLSLHRVTFMSTLGRTAFLKSGHCVAGSAQKQRKTVGIGESASSKYLADYFTLAECTEFLSWRPCGVSKPGSVLAYTTSGGPGEAPSAVTFGFADLTRVCLGGWGHLNPELLVQGCR